MSTWYFDSDQELDASSKNAVDQKLDELFRIGRPGRYGVLLYNDPLNGVDFVTRVIREVFGYSTSRAIWLMLKAHVTGKSLLWSGPHETARRKVARMIAFGPDPNMIHKGAEPLRIKIERQE